MARDADDVDEGVRPLLEDGGYEMNPRQFLKEYEQSHARDRLVDVVYEEMVEYCEMNDITTDDVGTDELEELAEGFVKRGFGVSESRSTRQSKETWE